MEPDLLGTAGKLTEAIRATHRRHPFEAAVRDFIRLIATAPDYPAADFSNDTIDALKVLAQDVIDHIEARISAGSDNDTAQQQDAGAVYEIRRLLEEIDRWRQHYLGTS